MRLQKMRGAPTDQSRAPHHITSRKGCAMIIAQIVTSGKRKIGGEYDCF